MKYHRFLSVLSLFLIAGFLGMAVSSCAPVPAARTEEPKLKLALIPVLDTIPIYIALQNGYFGEQGVDVELVPVKSPQERDVLLQTGQVDGVLTDGGIYFSEAGETLKRFHTLDGHGLKLLQKAGIVPAVITGRDSAPLRLRLSALGVEHAVFGTEDKRPAAEQMLASMGVSWLQAAAMGDDWPDLAVMRQCAFACAPANAHAEVKAHADHVTTEHGGHGAARAWRQSLDRVAVRYP